MEIKSHTEYLCRYKNPINDYDGRWFKIKVGHQTINRIKITFLEPYGPWKIGEFNWWFTEEFLSIYELSV